MKGSGMLGPLIICLLALRGEKLGTRFTDPVLRRRATVARVVLGVAMTAAILYFAADGRFTPSSGNSSGRARVTPREVTWNETPGKFVFAVALEIVIGVPLALLMLSPLVSAFVDRSGTRRGSRTRDEDRQRDNDALFDEARHGEAEAQFELALRQYKAQNYGEAAQWFRKAAEQGFGPAQHNLASLYASGYGVPQDKAQALE
jgi:hypothetical protein